MISHNKHCVQDAISGKSNFLLSNNINQEVIDREEESTTENKDKKQDKFIHNNDLDILRPNLTEEFIVNNYILLKKMGKGAFGEVYLAFNIRDNTECVVKIESLRYCQLDLEFIILKKILNLNKTSINNTSNKNNRILNKKANFSGSEPIIQDVVLGFAKFYGFGKLSTGSTYLITELLGPNLNDLFNYCNKRFSIVTVCLIAIQILHRIEFFHENNYIHRDIKPENFTVGYGKSSNIIYLIDFGLAKQYRDNKSKQHLPYRENRTMKGTARYVSINTHLGIEQSRRDDLESIGYMLIYFINGYLPWQGIKNINNQYEKILEKKLETPIEILCEKLNSEFLIYFKYIKSLKFEDKPDYSYLRNIFISLFDKAITYYNISNENIKFDWNYNNRSELITTVYNRNKNCSNKNIYKINSTTNFNEYSKLNTYIKHKEILSKNSIYHYQDANLISNTSSIKDNIFTELDSNNSAINSVKIKNYISDKKKLIEKSNQHDSNNLFNSHVLKSNKKIEEKITLENLEQDNEFDTNDTNNLVINNFCKENSIKTKIYYNNLVDKFTNKLNNLQKLNTKSFNNSYSKDNLNKQLKIKQNIKIKSKKNSDFEEKDKNNNSYDDTESIINFNDNYNPDNNINKQLDITLFSNKKEDIDSYIRNKIRDNTLNDTESNNNSNFINEEFYNLKNSLVNDTYKTNIKDNIEKIVINYENKVYSNNQNKLHNIKNNFDTIIDSDNDETRSYIISDAQNNDYILSDVNTKLNNNIKNYKNLSFSIDSNNKNMLRNKKILDNYSSLNNSLNNKIIQYNNNENLDYNTYKKETAHFNESISSTKNNNINTNNTKSNRKSNFIKLSNDKFKYIENNKITNIEKTNTYTCRKENQMLEIKSPIKLSFDLSKNYTYYKTQSIKKIQRFSKNKNDTKNEHIIKLESNYSISNNSILNNNSLLKLCSKTNVENKTKFLKNNNRSNTYKPMHIKLFSEKQRNINLTYNSLKISKDKLIKFYKTSVYNYYEMVFKTKASDSTLVNNFANYGSLVKSKLLKELRVLVTYKKSNVSLQDLTTFSVISHPNLIHLLEVYEDNINYNLILEYFSGLPLYSAIEYYCIESEIVFKSIIFKLLIICNYFYNNNLVNVFIDPNDIYVKFNINGTEFDQSKLCSSFEIKFLITPLLCINNNSYNRININQILLNIKKNYLLETNKNIIYLSPEVFRLENVYSNSCMWSIGFILYYMISKISPFDFKNYSMYCKMCDDTVNNDYDHLLMDTSRWDNISDNCKILIKKLLSIDYNNRPNSSKCLEINWFEEFKVDSITNKDIILFNNYNFSDEDNNIDIIMKGILKFPSENKLKKGLLYYITAKFTFDKKQEKNYFSNLYFLFDYNHEGYITFEKMYRVFKLFKNFKYTKKQRIEELFINLDLNSDNKVSFHELIASMINNHIFLNQDLIIKLFNFLDKDKNKSISIGEILFTLGGEKEMWKKLINELDSNFNEEIKVNDFINIMSCSN